MKENGGKAGAPENRPRRSFPAAYRVTTNLPFIKVEWPGKLQKKV